jgi:trimeric autotransporter adhesin
MSTKEIVRVALGAGALSIATFASAATCPFDGGGSDAVNDGLVLTRYALGITDAPLVASTRYASLDPLQVKNNIECVGCALDMNGDNAIDTVDTTIIARHLAGFSGNALTNGLALGSGSRPTPSSVQSFLASGCAAGGAINAFTQGGNSFGANAEIGLNDLYSLYAKVPGGGIRLQPTTFPGIIGVVAGSEANQILNSAVGATIAGGGELGGGANRVSSNYATVGGGSRNSAGKAADIFNGNQTVVGGYYNDASGYAATVLGGQRNVASGAVSMVGGTNSVSGGAGSVALGTSAIVRDAAMTMTSEGDEGTFVFADRQLASFSSTGPNQFNIRAQGGVRLHNSTSQFFGNQTRQMLNLWGTEYGIGVQSNTLYYRSGGQFSWFIGGAHCDGQGCWTPPGGPSGTENMRLTASSLLVNGTVVQSSDRGIKENFASVNPKSILAKVASLPISLWNYKADDNKTQHVGPMAQDFKRLFGVGQDDKTIATVDASGVALAAIQGLHALVKEKDAEIARLKEKAKRVDSLERDLAAVMKRLGMK